MQVLRLRRWSLPADALGFEDSQLLIGFHHNTPDNTLPIIWFDEPGGVPWNADISTLSEAGMVISMKDTTLNPFNITKAVDFSDQEINDYWVDISSGDGFTGLAKPTSPMPMLILGGKGSGKTHLMRYFSYPLQCIRHSRKMCSAGIKNDKYIGVYLRCSSLNSLRFREKGQREEMWEEVFAYYMELWLSQLMLGTVLSAFGGRWNWRSMRPVVVAELFR